MKYESTKPPVINREDLPEIVNLLETFDQITFNAFGEMVAVLKTTLPIIGPVVVSYYLRENHIKFYREGDDNDIWSGYIHNLDHDWEANNRIDRENLLSLLKNKLRARLTEL